MRLVTWALGESLSLSLCSLNVSRVGGSVCEIVFGSRKEPVGKYLPSFSPHLILLICIERGDAFFEI